MALRGAPWQVFKPSFTTRDHEVDGSTYSSTRCSAQHQLCYCRFPPLTTDHHELYGM